MRRSPSWAWLGGLTTIVFLFVTDALARPGGGQSFSGGGSGGGGYGGGGDEALGRLIVLLLFQYPQVGIPLLIGAAVTWYAVQKTEAKQQDWNSTTVSDNSEEVDLAFDELSSHDPDFSRVLLTDRLYSLYAQVHQARGRGALDSTSAYFSNGARESMAGLSDPLKQVHSVVVGSMQIVALQREEQCFVAEVRFQSNYSEVHTDDSEARWFVSELWVLHRNIEVRSKPPDAALSLGCPSCGAAAEAMSNGKCTYCDTQVDNGAFDWLVASCATLSREARGPALTSSVGEVGTSLPTRRHPTLRTDLAALQAADHQFSAANISKRAEFIHQQLNIAWSERTWQAVRPYVTDNLFQMMLYWIEMYKRAGLRNITEGARVERMILVKVAQDRWFDSITLRVFASGLDYTIQDGDNQLMSGSTSRERPFSEYWTLVRSAGSKHVPTDPTRCPQCGAEANINMAGSCEFCHSKVTSGNFDWVLSQIEQDEAYRG